MSVLSNSQYSGQPTFEPIGASSSEPTQQEFMLEVGQLLRQQPQDRILELIDKYQKEIEAQLNILNNGGDIEFDSLASSMHVLLMCLFASDRQLSSKMEDLARCQVQVTAKLIESTYNSYGYLTVQLIGSGLNLASGLGGMVTAARAASTADYGLKMCKYLGVIGSGFQSVASIFQNTESSKRELAQVSLQLLQSKEGQYRSDNQQGNQREEQMQKTLQDILEKVNRTIEAILRG